MRLLFLLSKVPSLQEFIPIIIAAKDKSIESIIFYRKNVKNIDWDPITNLSIIKKICVRFSINLFPLKMIDIEKKTDDILICNEGDEITKKVRAETSYLFSMFPTISLTKNKDYAVLFKKYIDDVHTVVFPSITHAEYYNCISPKNLYIGSPKYDNLPFREDVLKKYKIPDDNYILFFFPKFKFFKNQEAKMNKFVDELNKITKYKVIMKIKDRRTKIQQRKDFLYFYGEEDYPCLSLELLSVSKFAIVYESTATEECVASGVPFMYIKNFPTVANPNPMHLKFDFLHLPEISIMGSIKDSVSEIESHIKYLENLDMKEFSKIQDKFQLKSQNSSERLIEYIQSSVIS